jgi:hypothetical protein
MFRWFIFFAGRLDRCRRVGGGSGTQTLQLWALILNTRIQTAYIFRHTFCLLLFFWCIYAYY